MTHKIIDPEYRKKLLALAKKVAAKHEVSLSYLGATIVKDADFFPNIEAGKDCRAATLVKVEKYLSTASAQ